MGYSLRFEGFTLPLTDREAAELITSMCDPDSPEMWYDKSSEVTRLIDIVDDHMKDKEFSENLCKTLLAKHVKWLRISEAHIEDPDWDITQFLQEQINYLLESEQ